MTRQLSDEVCNAARSEALRFLASRPDLGPADIAQYTTLAESTVRMFLRATMPGGREVVAEIERVIAQIKAGEILQPGGAQQAVVFLESGQRRERRVMRRNTFYETETSPADRRRSGLRRGALCDRRSDRRFRMWEVRGREGMAAPHGRQGRKPGIRIRRIFGVQQGGFHTRSWTHVRYRVRARIIQRRPGVP